MFFSVMATRFLCRVLYYSSRHIYLPTTILPVVTTNSSQPVKLRDREPRSQLVLFFLSSHSHQHNKSLSALPLSRRTTALALPERAAREADKAPRARAEREGTSEGAQGAIEDAREAEKLQRQSLVQGKKKQVSPDAANTKGAAVFRLGRRRRRP